MVIGVAFLSGGTVDPVDLYRHLYCDVNPADPVVAAEIQRGIRHPYGLTDVHDHLPRLRKAAKGSVLEIGVRFGSSTAALLAGVQEKGGHLWSVDIDDCSGIFPGHPQWSFMQYDSRRNSNDILSVIPERLDLLFVDGDHTYEGVLMDLMNFGPLSSVIMLHDANEVENPDVLRAIGHYLSTPKAKQKNLELFTDSHGLAVTW